ncbi:MAG: hypothetical protein NWR96_02685 [Crocinitomicaceae bacterium]|jgi:hypothetical protein|nr:hypothetical protein [Crocinitomicaceae bacterium]MDP4760514.1 hypothetical protein [Crocinitomicaceae bacterium]
MNALREDKINYANIGLMLITAVLAYFFPFETFLLAYAYLGPLHYLTEISWLHDRNYFSKGKYDFLILLIVGILLSYAAFAKDFGVSLEVYDYFVKMNLFDKLLVFALFSSILFALVKNLFVKIIAILFLYVFVSGWLSPDNSTSNAESTTVFALTSLVPTLIHVYLFTGLFMLFGSLKTRSVSGMWQMVGFVVVPLLLVFALPVDTKAPISKFGKDAHYAKGDGFYATNISIMDHFNLIEDPIYTNADFVAFVNKKDFKDANAQYQFIAKADLKKIIDSLNKKPNAAYVMNKQPINPNFQADNILALYLKPEVLNEYQMKPMPAKIFSGFSLEKYASIVYNSTVGIMLMRFIAFAYLYHYLNWFSKTEVIRWHQVPKLRFAAVILLWVVASVFYTYDYSLGLSLLFFLSFSHVLLEFPLNIISIVGIGKESLAIMKNGFKAPTN